MSDYRVDKITNQSGTAGPQIAGITTFSSTSGMLMPSGNTARRLVSDFVPKNIIDDGLVLYLDAGNSASYSGSGTTWTDLSGNDNTGTLTNGPTYSSANGGSLIFDGVDDYLEYSKQFFSGTDNFTISVWLKSDGTQVQYSCPISQGHFNNTGFAFQIGFPSPSDMRFVLGDGSSWQSLSFNYNTNSNFDWHHLVVTKNNNSFATYKDGNSTASGTHIINYGTYNFSIGRDTYNTDSSHRVWKGKISQVSIYNRALSADEISQNFNALRSRYSI